MTELNKVRARNDKLWNIILELCKITGVPSDEQATTLIAEVKKLVVLSDTVADREKKLAEANLTISDLENNLKSLKETNETLEKKEKQMETELARQSQMIDSQSERIADLSETIETLKKNVKVSILTGWKRFIVSILERM